MSCDTKLLSSCYKDILNATINPSSAYMPALHHSAESMRDTVEIIDTARRVKLARVYASCGGLKKLSEPKQVYELKALLETEGLTEEQRLQANAALDELRKSFKDANEEFKSLFFDAVKEIKNARYDLSESELMKNVNKALSAKRRELAKLITWSKETIEPLLKNIAQQAAAVDQSIIGYCNENLFDKAVAFIPGGDGSLTAADLKKNATESICPEVAAIKYALQVTKESLKVLSTGWELCKLVDKSVELRHRRDELQNLYDEAQRDCRTAEIHINECIELLKLADTASIYLNESAELESDLTDFTKKFNSATTGDYENGDYYRLALELSVFLGKLNLIWR